MLLQIVFKCFNINVWGRDWAGVTATITRPLSIFLLCFCVAWKQLMINWEFPQYWYHHAHHHREGQILSTRAGNVHLNSGVIFIITWLIKSSSKYSKFWSFWKALKTPLCIPHCQLFKCQVMTMICGPQVNQVIKMQFKKNGEQQDKWCKIKWWRMMFSVEHQRISQTINIVLSVIIVILYLPQVITQHYMFLLGPHPVAYTAGGFRIKRIDELKDGLL